MRKTVILLISISLFISLTSSAQKERKFAREGNRLYAKGLEDTVRLDSVRFGKAEIAYRKALQEKPDDFHWQFNLADALYKQAKPKQAASAFEGLVEQTDDDIEKASVYHNLGNSLLAQNKVDESIEAYKSALRLNPGDIGTKYNLIYAQKIKKEQQQNKDKQNQNKDKNKDKDQNKDQDKDKNDQDKDDKNDQDQQNKNREKRPQQNKITRENAERLLQALENDEKETQDKVKKMKAKQAKKEKVEKDW